MVSLNNDSRNSGGYFFEGDHSIQSSHDSEDFLLDPTIIFREGEIAFKKIKTPWVIVAQAIVVIVIVIITFVMSFICTDVKNTCHISSYALVVYIHGGSWFVHLLIDRFLRYHHHISRKHGYLQFYRKTCNIRRLPFMVNSCANAVLLIMVKVLEDQCPSSMSSESNCLWHLSRNNWVQIIVSIETAAVLPILVIYLIWTLKFNNQAASPDVNQDELSSGFVTSRSGSTEIGIKDEDYLDQVMEKQADMIRYLKQHNMQLGKRVLTLTAEINALKAEPTD